MLFNPTLFPAPVAPATTGEAWFQVRDARPSKNIFPQGQR